MPITADCAAAAKNDLQKESEAGQKLIPTPFGKLTSDEIREWEEMLGRPLVRLQTQT